MPSTKQLAASAALALYSGLAQAQNATVTSNPTVTFANPSGYTMTSFNYTAVSTYLPNTDYSNEQLQLLWDQVGPISKHPINTTVSPTPEATPYAQPGFLHSLVPAYNSEIADAKLPDDFLWGVASAALQVEGAAADEGKGPSVWDFLPHRWVNSIMDNSTADIAANSYYLYKQDSLRLKALGIPAYSFSFSWPRLFPFGSGPVNVQGVQHYDDFIADLLANGIKPVGTLFHWDTPLALFNSYGAWTGEPIVKDYVNYAKFVIERYDKYVDTWFTFNEPQYCNFRFADYPWGTLLPSYNGVGTGGNVAKFLCGHYTLLAHAEVYQWYKNEFKGTKPMTMKNSGNYVVANSTSAADAEALKRVQDFSLGWFGGCWVDGDYPQSLKDTLNATLPQFTEEQKAMIKGSCDFYAIDAYTTYYAAAPPNGIDACTANATDPNYPICAISSPLAPDGFPIGPNADAGATWLQSTPGGVRPFLSYITKDYFPSVKSIAVTEFGFSDPAEGSFDTKTQILWDLRRADYIQSFLDGILAARAIDGVNVTGIFAWAIYDNYEWNSGLGTKFGLQYLNATSQERTPKASMFQLLNWFKQHGGSAANATSKTNGTHHYGRNLLGQM